MYKFWDEMIKPIFLEENVKSILEIGCESGRHTLKMLDYCLAKKAKLLSIDPSPLFDADQLEAEYDFFKVIKNISLKELANIENYDAVLIDGDHNWYTVYHELKMIENKAQEQGKFPIVFLHDTDWPYGRRDMYYFPETIPEEFRKAYAKKGMLPGHIELIEADSELDQLSINKSLNNATIEGGEKNGVLTAVEDFLKESSFPLNFFNLNANHGLGIIFQKSDRLLSVIESAAEKFKEAYEIENRK
ncbi:class I SAM-dependent methyltransferase [Cytobacillus sp. FSL H8-0458]|uniref:class I SAM-dependent methyltransferase n=1 Tax=Cytobacillus sp. FSL H8-0458 TaxID=2975346 RepID=UPI0030F77C41